MRAINIEEMDFIAGGYDYGVDYDETSDNTLSDSAAAAQMQQVVVVGQSMTWYEKLVYDISQYLGNAAETPAKQAVDDLASTRAANPDCSVTQTIHIENGTASSTFGTTGVNVSMQDSKSGETFTVTCPPLNK